MFGNRRRFGALAAADGISFEEVAVDGIVHLGPKPISILDLHNRTGAIFVFWTCKIGLEPILILDWHSMLGAAD